MSDSTIDTSSIASLYSNQMLVSSLLSSSTSVEDAVSSALTTNTSSDYSDIIEDYADITEEAINAYQDEVNKGTVLNSSLRRTYTLYDTLINSSNSSSSSTYSVSADLILESLNN